MKELKEEFEKLQGAQKDVQAAMEDGSIVTKGKAAGAAGKKSVLEAYKHAYPDKPIVAPKK